MQTIDKARKFYWGDIAMKTLLLFTALLALSGCKEEKSILTPYTQNRLRNDLDVFVSSDCYIYLNNKEENSASGGEIVIIKKWRKK